MKVLEINRCREFNEKTTGIQNDDNLSCEEGRKREMGSLIDHKICIISWHRPHLDAAIKECAVHAQFTAEISSFIRVSSPSGDLIDSLFVSKPFFHLSFI